MQTAIDDVAKRLEVSTSTLRTWGEKFGIFGARTTSDQPVYSEREIEVLELIKQLRSNEAGYRTIRRHLESASTAPVFSD